MSVRSSLPLSNQVSMRLHGAALTIDSYSCLECSELDRGSAKSWSLSHGRCCCIVQCIEVYLAIRSLTLQILLEHFLGVCAVRVFLQTRQKVWEADSQMLVTLESANFASIWFMVSSGRLLCLRYCNIVYQPDFRRIVFCCTSMFL